jgi:hypothetical protein
MICAHLKPRANHFCVIFRLHKTQKKPMKTTIWLAIVLTFALTAAVPRAEKPGKWTSLFDGKTMTGWHNYLKTEAKGWKIEGGALTTETDNHDGDLVSDKEYGDFELEFTFKTQAKNGNGGVIYKVIEDPKIFATYASGPEFQVIDDKGYEWKDGTTGKLLNLSTKQMTGASYDILAPADLTVAKPVGEWNTGRIVVKANHIEHFLNGKKVVEYDYGSDAWKAMVAQSKFAKLPYATAHERGKIALQGHGNDKAWYKDIKIREL